MHSPMAHDTTNIVPDKKKDTPLEGGHSTKISAMWNLKHEIRSPKFYELLIKTELKRENYLELNNFYNYIKMYINKVARIQKDILPAYYYINKHSECEEYSIRYCGHLSYSWNTQTYTSLGQSILFTLYSNTCVKFSRSPQA